MRGVRPAPILPFMSQQNETPGQNPAIDLSNALAAIVRAAGGHVVRVEARHRMPSSGIVWSAEGVVVTAEHTVEKDEDVTLGLPDGRSVPATLVGRDPGTDIAVLRAEASDLAVPDWAAVEELQVGHLVLSLMRPGRTARASLGVVTALGDEEWRAPGGGRLDRYLQVDIGLQWGFSGSLLVDARGRAVGLGTSGLLRRHAMVVPAATLRRVVESLLTHGRVRRGFLGIGAHPVRLPPDLAAREGMRLGLILIAVEPGSAADQGGLRLGDVLLSFDGQPLEDPGQLHFLLHEDRVGTEVTVRILRGGEARDLRVTVGSR
jgi:S1-C subfamily serine protease